jgi:hypothetical protein
MRTLPPIEVVRKMNENIKMYLKMNQLREEQQDHSKYIELL